MPKATQETLGDPDGCTSRRSQALLLYHALSGRQLFYSRPIHPKPDRHYYSRQAHWHWCRKLEEAPNVEDTPIMPGDSAGAPEEPPTVVDDIADALADISSMAAMFLAETTPESTDATLSALRRAGLDEDMVGSVAEGLRRGDKLEALLLETFGHLVAAPQVPRRAGSLLVVAGAGEWARELAAAVAPEIGADPAEVPFASLDPQARTVVADNLLVRSTEIAAELAPGWRRSRAAVVVVDAPMTARPSWATHLITALRPTAVWGIVDATCKTDDIAAWADALGGLDALALKNLGATVSPAAVLRLGIPVVQLEGQHASAMLWSAIVVDQVAADARTQAQGDQA